MEAGTTFLVADKSVDDHLWVILSDPKIDAEKVLVVNLTTLDARKEQVCILKPGGHPWIRHDTCVNYGDSYVTTLDILLEWKDKGLLQIMDPMPQAILQRMREAVADSTRIPMDNANVLIEQGLLDL